VIGKGCDTTGLGRWTWTRFWGWDNHTLQVISAYRPNPPAGPFTVCAQHREYFNKMNDIQCPREAFLEDISKAIEGFQSEGDHIILLINGNTSMKSSDMVSKFKYLQLQDVILDKHGLDGPTTNQWNNTRTPIDGIWATSGITLLKCGYLAYDKACMGTDCRRLRVGPVI
jgi:hypothetical protein